MTTKRRGKKFLKISGISFGILLVLLTGFHFWFKAYAKHLIEDLVESRSHGKLKLKIGKFHFSYFSRKMEMEKAVFYSADSSNTSYSFSIERVKMEVQAILPILFRKQMLFDSLTLINPDIKVTRLRAALNDSTKVKKEISIPEEMGKVYHSIQDALKVLKVTRFQIDNGKFTLINKIQPEQLPLVITRINFHIDNLFVDTTKLGVKEKMFFSDNVVMHCFNQDIVFPDGRHRLSFSQFRINLRKKVVEFDSCTISATRGDSSSTSFNVFTDALYLTNINFDTLYRHEVIKADSVYCINPKFNLDVKLGRKKNSGKSPPILENIIKQLTGDLQLGFVIVANADFNIKTEKNGKPSSFTFTRNNFEMQGLSIDQDDSKPIRVKNFTMAIRNYENFIKDSSYSVQFDSVIFREDRIYLSNFIFHKLDNGKIINTFNVPRLNLAGLSWDDLVFEKKIHADQATLFSPYISYTESQKPKKFGSKPGIFQSLSAINDYMDLNSLDVQNGTINLDLRDHVLIDLENASFSIKSHAMLTSTRLAEIKNSLTKLSFVNGKIRAGDLSIGMKGIRYTGQSGQFSADAIDVNNVKENMSFLLQQVAVDKMKVDEQTGDVSADGIKWQQADIKFMNPGSRKQHSSPSIELRNVHGINTSINLALGNKQITSLLNSVSWNELEKKDGSKLKLTGLALNGSQLNYKDDNQHMSVANYQFTDQQPSNFRLIAFKSENEKVQTDISIPALSLVPHVQSLLDGAIVLDDILLSKPILKIHIAANAANNDKKTGLPKININEFSINQPEIEFSKEPGHGNFSFSWQGAKNSSDFLHLSGIQNEEDKIDFSIEKIGLNLSDFYFTEPGGKTFHSGNGKIAAQIREAGIKQALDQPMEWKAIISQARANDFRFDSMDKAGGSLFMNSAALQELHISSAWMKNLLQLAAANPAFQLNGVNGHYSNPEKSIWWYNGSFNRKNNEFSLDSFEFRQELSLDSFMASQKFQSDFMNTKTGAISIGPIDIDQYLKDSTFNIGMAKADHVLFTDIKDKKLPFNSGVIKPLPVNLIRQIPLRLSIDSVLLTNSNLSYTEKVDSINKSGTIPVTRITASLSNIKNYNLTASDSLRILIVGYLMDSVWTRLKVKESYTDTAGGFLMTVRMKPASATVLNPVLIPLSSVKIVTGYLDTLSMSAVGREYISLGEMKMFYHDLKIRFLINGDETKKSFRNSLLNFFANSFVIRNKNTSRTGKVFFIRNRERSSINYLIKIALSGISSSVGAKSNRKIMRNYRNELRHLNLQPINFD